MLLFNLFYLLVFFVKNIFWLYDWHLVTGVNFIAVLLHISSIFQKRNAIDIIFFYIYDVFIRRALNIKFKYVFLNKI